MWIRKLRLWAGVAVAVFVVLHLSNHMVGTVSIEVAEGVRRTLGVIYRSRLGQVLLYGALATHVLLALWSLYRRSHLRMPAWEAAQILIGLAIPVLLALHVVGTRGFTTYTGVEARYASTVAAIWSGGVWSIVKQSALVLVVWGHLMVGLHFWLRVKAWYPRALLWLYPLALLLPALALLGFYRMGFEVSELARSPGWLQQVFARHNAALENPVAWVNATHDKVLLGLLGLLVVVLAGRVVRRLWRNRYGTFRVSYGDARAVRSRVGDTVLETSRAAGIAHASVCGGRGRCTTCRIHVLEGAELLHEPDPTERTALARIQAVENVRLACQARPRHDLKIKQLLPATATARDGRRPGGVEGEERTVTALFVDLRGSTKLQEHKLPYDVVFILNQFFAEMAEALNVTGGHYAQFSGDGLLALYGLDTDVEEGCRQAVSGALEMLRRLEGLNHSLALELPAPLRIGIGIHAGEAIVGTMGPPASPIRSAIGDTINTAARLEGLSKTLECVIVISQETARLAGLDLSAYPSHIAEVRGREQTIAVYALPAGAEIAVALPRRR